jgi:hypothetical protein
MNKLFLENVVEANNQWIKKRLYWTELQTINLKVYLFNFYTGFDPHTHILKTLKIEAWDEINALLNLNV